MCHFTKGSAPVTPIPVMLGQAQNWEKLHMYV
jgi:hypothetical protein